MEIGETSIIKKLSGPVNFFLLEPVEKNLLKYENMFPPVIMLFGDIHEGRGGECENNNYQIYSSNFLKLFNSLSSDEFPIDFNFEKFFSNDEMKAIKNNKTFEIKNSTLNKNSPMKIFEENTKLCFFKNLKNKFNCPAPNLRWHYVDIRFTNSDSQYDFESKIIIFLLKRSFIRPTNNKNKDYEPFTDDMNQLLNILLMLLSDIINNTTTFIEYYFTNDKFTTNSLVYKQILKQCESLRRVSIWKKWFTQYYTYLISTLDKYNLNKNFKIFEEFVSKLRKKDSDISKFTRDNLEIIYNIVNIPIQLTSIFMDMYYITRMFKIPENSTNPILSIGYFGFEHTKNITYFLTNIMNLYKIKYENENENLTTAEGHILLNMEIPKDLIFRCIIFPKFNLNDILNKYKKLRNDKENPKKEISSPKKEISSPKKEISSPKKEISSPKKEISSSKKEISSPKKKIEVNEDSDEEIDVTRLIFGRKNKNNENSYTVPELKNFAKQLKIINYSTMLKQELIDVIKKKLK